MLESRCVLFHQYFQHFYNRGWKWHTAHNSQRMKNIQNVLVSDPSLSISRICSEYNGKPQCQNYSQLLNFLPSCTKLKLMHNNDVKGTFHTQGSLVEHLLLPAIDILLSISSMSEATGLDLSLLRWGYPWMDTSSWDLLMECSTGLWYWSLCSLSW